MSAYAVMCLVAYLVLVTKQRRALIYFWFAVFVLYSVIVRTRPLTGDYCRICEHAGGLAAAAESIHAARTGDMAGGALAHRLVGSSRLVLRRG